MNIAVIFAMEEEKEAFFRFFEAIEAIKKDGLLYYHLPHEKHLIHCIQSGIGKVNAAYKTARFLQQHPYDIIINTGIAGGVNREVFEVVLGEKLIYHDVDVTAFNYPQGQVPGMPNSYYSDPQYVDVFKQAMREHPYINGTIASGDQFMTSLTPLKSFMESTPDLHAVDMESTAIAQIAYLENIPFLSFRIISDVLGSPTQTTDEKTVETATLKSGEVLKRVCDAL